MTRPVHLHACMSYSSMCSVNTHIIHLPLNCPVDPLLFLRNHNQTLISSPVFELTELGSSLIVRL